MIFISYKNVMKRKIVIAIYIIIIFITLNIICNIVITNNIVNKYKIGEYLEAQAKFLTNINFQKSYISNYNYGNILYKNGEYEEAIEEYKKALNTVLSKNKECKIRINYALAICQTVQVDEKDQESISKAINTYESAIDVLEENDCDSHDKKARKLKEDIQAEIDRLKNLQENSEEDSGDDEKEEQETPSKKEQTIEEKIQNIKEEATKEQRETETRYKSYNKQYKDRGKNW